MQNEDTELLFNDHMAKTARGDYKIGFSKLFPANISCTILLNNKYVMEEIPAEWLNIAGHSVQDVLHFINFGSE
jgi:hypothetical protein